jgi:hypothetical protein
LTAFRHVLLHVVFLRSCHCVGFLGLTRSRQVAHRFFRQRGRGTGDNAGKQRQRGENGCCGSNQNAGSHKPYRGKCTPFRNILHDRCGSDSTPALCPGKSFRVQSPNRAHRPNDPAWRMVVGSVYPDRFVPVGEEPLFRRSGACDAVVMRASLWSILHARGEKAHRR